MEDGFWINYGTGAVHWIDEHERWIRRGRNADELGVPADVQEKFDEYKEVVDRNMFLLYVMTHSPTMRVRGHGCSWTFEFNSDSMEKPLDAVLSFCRKRAGPYTRLVITNFGKERAVIAYWMELQGLNDQNPTRIREFLRRHIAKFKLKPEFSAIAKPCGK